MYYNRVAAKMLGYSGMVAKKSLIITCFVIKDPVLRIGGMCGLK
jgi:hypothetical protein